jgi:uncharacterized protein
MRRFLVLLMLIGSVASAILIGLGYRNALRDPVIRTAEVAMADWPAAAPPIRVLLLSDIHVAGPDMPPERLSRIVDQLNAIKPDLVLIAGDLVSEKRLATHIYAPDEIVAPLKRFAMPVVIAPGNHDHWYRDGAVITAARDAGLSVLQNEAMRTGPLVIGGIDDDYSRHADVPKALAAMAARGPGPRIILTHSPDIVLSFPNDIAAVFAGHTHCGQALKPWSGEPFVEVSKFGPRFRCGRIADGGQTVFVGAGLGTSGLWLRYGAPPDAWLVTLGPPAAPAPKPAQ